MTITYAAPNHYNSANKLNNKIMKFLSVSFLSPYPNELSLQETQMSMHKQYFHIRTSSWPGSLYSVFVFFDKDFFFVFLSIVLILTVINLKSSIYDQEIKNLEPVYYVCLLHFFF